MLCSMPPAMETSTRLSFGKRLSSTMPVRESRPPAKAYIMALTPPNIRPESSTFRAIRI